MPASASASDLTLAYLSPALVASLGLDSQFHGLDLQIGAQEIEIIALFSF